MMIAIPMTASFTIFHDNPCLASQFALFIIEGERNNLVFRLDRVIENPWDEKSNREATDAFEHHCGCSAERKNDLDHILEHYILIESISGCDYLLADTYCVNTVNSLKKAGIKLYKIAPFIHDTDKAVKHFLIGENYADTVQHIHYAS